MNKRQFLNAGMCLGLLLSTGLAVAQDAVMSSPKIIQSLSKDIVLDGARPSANQARVSVDLQVQFAFNSAELLPVGKQQLDQLAAALNSKDLMSWGFELAGHTDRVGSADYNLKLSLERANAVKNYLVVSHGINAARLIPLGLGFSRPANPADPGAAINRRVEVRKVAMNLGAVVPAAPAVAPAQAPARMGGRLVATP